ncbi:hypothetical protein D3C81_1797340 [compost metagenome]
MADLGNEGGHAQARVDLVFIHGQRKRRGEHASLLAGVREDLQQLLLSDRHTFLQAKKSPRMAGLYGVAFVSQRSEA